MIYLLYTNSILIHSLYLFVSFAWGLRMLFMTSQRTRRTTSPIPWNQMQWDLAEKSRRWIDGLWRKRVLAVTQIWNVRRSQKENVEHGGMSQMLTHGCIACEIMRVNFVHGWWSKQQSWWDWDEWSCMFLRMLLCVNRRQSHWLSDQQMLPSFVRSSWSNIMPVVFPLSHCAWQTSSVPRRTQSATGCWECKFSSNSRISWWNFAQTLQKGIKCILVSNCALTPYSDIYWIIPTYPAPRHKATSYLGKGMCRSDTATAPGHQLERGSHQPDIHPRHCTGAGCLSRIGMPKLYFVHILQHMWENVTHCDNLMTRVCVNVCPFSELFRLKLMILPGLEWRCSKEISPKLNLVQKYICCTCAQRVFTCTIWLLFV